MGRVDFRRDARLAIPGAGRKSPAEAGARSVAPGFSRGNAVSIRMGACFNGRQNVRPEVPGASHRRPLSPAEAGSPTWGACSKPPAEAGGYGSFFYLVGGILPMNNGELRFTHGRSLNG